MSPKTSRACRCSWTSSSSIPTPANPSLRSTRISGTAMPRCVYQAHSQLPEAIEHQKTDFNMLQGVYSGVVASGNGNSNDDSNLNTTFLRGVQPSGHDGVVRFESIFPGHYTGRAIHIHGMVLLKAYLLPKRISLLLTTHVTHSGYPSC